MVFSIQWTLLLSPQFLFERLYVVSELILQTNYNQVRFLLGTLEMESWNKYKLSSLWPALIFFPQRSKVYQVIYDHHFMLNSKITFVGFTSCFH